MENERKLKRLTAMRLQQLKAASRELRRDVADVGIDLGHLPKDAREKLIADGLWWAWVYELSMVQHLTAYFYLIGLIAPLRAALDASDDKVQAFIDFAKNHDPDEVALAAVAGPEANAERRALWASLFISLLRQIECLEREGSYMSDLVAKVRNGGAEGETAFLKALHMDRTIVSCPTFGGRITRAALKEEQPFFDNLARGIKTKWNKTSPKRQESHKDLRVVLQAMHEAGQLQTLSMTEADKLFIQELGIYSDQGEDPVRSLQRFILRFKNNK
jgi:hypothetical protein